MKKPEKKYIIESNFSATPNIIHDCEIKKMGYNKCRDEYEKFMPSENDIYVIIWEAMPRDCGGQVEKVAVCKNIAKVISKRIGVK